jgi:hypothetical protein
MRLRDVLARANRMIRRFAGASGRIFVPSKRCRSRHRDASPRSAGNYYAQPYGGPHADFHTISQLD